MSSTVCWLFFDAVLLPADGYLVPCDVCLVSSGVVLTYDTAVEPPNQSGVIITPSTGAPSLAARFMLPLESKQ